MIMHKCELKDLEALREISIETFSDTFAADNTPEDLKTYLDRAYNKEQLLTELKNPNSFFYFIYMDGNLAGYLKLNTGLAQTEEMGAESLEVERIYVRTAFKRRGLGKQLIDFAIETARELNKQAIWLGVWEHNDKALAFYKSLGFEQTGAHSFFMGDDEQTDFVMTKRLGD
ncbi:GNAT family N-acetyltransferase [Jeotgalibaca sp. A127]|uniref:GNAT family N-acetyltransferase n=1 Tax=Jeotgalibaca sp. A127 TaxID=3457324 RepID=UPI003FD65B54